MLAIIGFIMICTFMILIMTKKMSVLSALIIIPVIFGIISGFGPELGKMILKGVLQVAPIGLMLMFAVLYFSIMMDAGLFEPMVKGVVRIIGDDPMKIAFGTTIVSLIVSMSGDAVSTALVVFATFIPIYARTGMNVMVMATLLALSNSVLNLLPWGGPLARVASSLHLEPNDIFLPLIPTMLITSSAILVLTWWFGRTERIRLNYVPCAVIKDSKLESEQTTSNPRKKIILWINLILTLCVLGAMGARLAPLPVVFMIGVSIALLINFPSLKEQREKLASYADNAFTIISLIFASGALIGIMTETGMVTQMAQQLVRIVPATFGPVFAAITGVLSLPLLLFMSNDAYYFGILPVIAQLGATYNVPAIEIARASMLGMPVHMFSPLLPALYLLAGMLKADVGMFQRFALKWAVVISIVMIIGAIVTGAIHFL